MAAEPSVGDWELTPATVKGMLDAGRPVLLLDCRTPGEWATAKVEGATLVPMQDIPARVVELEDLAEDKDVVVMCHHGQRSLQVTAWLREQGFEGAMSMAGGIDRWSLEIDPAVPRY